MSALLSILYLLCLGLSDLFLGMGNTALSVVGFWCLVGLRLSSLVVGLIRSRGNWGNN